MLTGLAVLSFPGGDNKDNENNSNSSVGNRNLVVLLKQDVAAESAIVILLSLLYVTS